MNITVVLVLGALSVLMVLVGLRGRKTTSPELDERLSAFANRAGGIEDDSSKEGFATGLSSRPSNGGRFAWEPVTWCQS